MGELKTFLDRHSAFGTWRVEWRGVPLEFRSCLGSELPPREAVGSVRAIVLREEEVLVVYDPRPILSVGGRCHAGETIHQTLLREVSEETGWRVRPIAVIGFVHARHLDEQRPDWGRPAPDFIEPFFAVSPEEYDAEALGEDENRSEFVPVSALHELNIDEINRTFLNEALKRRAET